MSIPVLCLCTDVRDICYDMTSSCYGKCSRCCGATERHNKDLAQWAADGCQRGQEKPIHKEFLLHLRNHHGNESSCRSLGIFPIGEKHSGNGAPQGAFAFTLTKSPADDLTEKDMIEAVRKIMKQKSCPVVRYAWYLEYGDKENKTHPHIHGMYETESGGVIEKKHWKRAWKIWDPAVKLGAGFRGGYHRPVRLEENYSDYIKKDMGLCEHT